MSRAVAPRRWAPADSVACCQAAARTVREFRADGLAGSIPKKHMGNSGAMEMGEWMFFFLERYGNNQPWLIFLGSLFNSKWRSVKVFPGIERPIVRIPKTVLVVSSCWPSWFISRVFFVGFMADILNNSWGLQTNKPTSMTGGVPPCSHGIILGIYVA